MQSNSITRTIAITGGKGGVGKTHTAVNIAAALVRVGQRVVLLDADLGLSNIDIMLGLKPQHDLSDVLQGRCTLKDILIEGPLGIKILPGASGISEMASLAPQAFGGLVHSFSELLQTMDFLVIDTAAGIAPTNLRFIQSSQEVILVVCNEPASLTDAYAMIKVLATQYGVKRFRIIANMVQSKIEGEEIFAKLTNVTDKFIKVPLHYLGSIPFDSYAKKAIKLQKLLLEVYPSSKGAEAFIGLAQKLMKLPLPQSAQGHLEFFMEQFV